MTTCARVNEGREGHAWCPIKRVEPYGVSDVCRFRVPWNPAGATIRRSSDKLTWDPIVDRRRWSHVTLNVRGTWRCRVIVVVFAIPTYIRKQSRCSCLLRWVIASLLQRTLLLTLLNFYEFSRPLDYIKL